MERTNGTANDHETYSLNERLIQPTQRSYDDERAVNEGIHLASLLEKKRLWLRNAIVNAMFIASWFFFAMLLSVYNKWMFSANHYGFPAPLFVTTMHMWIQFILAAVLRYAWPRTFRPAHKPSRKDYATKAAPTAVATGLDIGLSNLSLKTITLSFYTMCKSSSLIFVLFFAFLFRLETFSWRLVAVIFLIFAGVLLMVATEAEFLLQGFILVISASALGGLRWSLTQVLLKSKKIGFDNPAATIFWLAPSMGITLGIVSLALENWPSIFRGPFFLGRLKTLETTLYMTAPGIVAFCMVLSEYYIIQRAGVVPMSIAGIAKEVSTILVSAWFFGDKLTLLNAVGVSITVCGIGLFTHHKYRKSIDSSVPLDAHGNAITDDNETDGPEDYAHPEETIRLTSSQDDEDLLTEVRWQRRVSSLRVEL
ncbi:triose-phosphate transporter family-domain-containing protein [Crepidotus variabilis]|uniref:Triose-phosphate transporter family-domain-containing protein n=1 Tax=Crepidotus variabilis TaxID=179855 RepID=A0A9P6JQA1_9AGAR|nr:triose-phosphate transporter family-domain-containing protein [Crepidotus variabilis]